MSISSIGYSQTYYYNTVTKKFTSRDENGGQAEDFLESEGGQGRQKLTDCENGQQSLLEAFLRVQREGEAFWDRFRPVEGQENVYEVTYTRENELEAFISVDGQEVFREMPAFLLPGTLSGEWDYVFPDKASYDKELNSAVIAPGDSFVLKNGYEIEIRENGAYVTEDSYGMGGRLEDAYAEKIANGLDELIKAANRGCFGLAASGMGENLTQDILQLIGQAGIDTEKEFILNGTRFRVEDNKLSIQAAFSEGSKVWEREAAWRREALWGMLRDEADVSDAELQEENLIKPLSKKGNGAPYSYLADEFGIINYNGVQFVCDNEKKQLCLGDMSNPDNVIRIPLSEGGCLMVNRNNIGDLGRAISMFSPEDIQRILRALNLDAKLQQTKKEIEEMEDGIGKNSHEEFAENTQEAEKAAREAGKTGGFSGYEEDEDIGISRLEEWQLDLLLEETSLIGKKRPAKTKEKAEEKEKAS